MIDPGDFSSHWRECANPDCWICRPNIATRNLKVALKQERKDEAVPAYTSPRPHTFEESLDIMYAQCRQVMIDRHRKYGRGNIDAFGRQGVVVRLSDKLARLKTLLFSSRGAEAGDEKELDTWIDIANYGVIGLLLLCNMWGLPMKGDKSESAGCDR